MLERYIKWKHLADLLVLMDNDRLKSWVGSYAICILH